MHWRDNLNPLLRTVAAVFVGAAVGILVVALAYTQGGILFPLPDGEDESDSEALRAAKARYSLWWWLFFRLQPATTYPYLHGLQLPIGRKMPVPSRSLAYIYPAVTA